MTVSSLREITIGVQDLDQRARQFAAGCGLSVQALARLTPVTANRLFDAHESPRAAILGRPDVMDAPRIRLVECPEVRPSRPGGIGEPGPLGIGFATAEIEAVQGRLAEQGVDFVSPPGRAAAGEKGAGGSEPPGTQRFQSFGRCADGDMTVLSPRIRPTTPDGFPASDCSEPLHASFVVTNLDAGRHFMEDVLEHETLMDEFRSGPPFGGLPGLDEDVSFRWAMFQQPGRATGRCLLLEFERNPFPMAPTSSLRRGICRLRYDTTDMHHTLGRVPGGGGTLVRGPASIDDPVLGRGLVAMIRSPFGVLIELWELR